MTKKIKKRKVKLKRTGKLYCYLDMENDCIIAVIAKQKPRPSKRMKVVYDYLADKRKFGMATFPEIPNSLLFSKRFIFLGKLSKDYIY